MAVRWLSDLRGTLLTAFGIGRSTLDASGLSAARTHALPDESGTLALEGAAAPQVYHLTDQFGDLLCDQNYNPLIVVK